MDCETLIFTYVNSQAFVPVFLGKNSGPIWTPSSPTDSLHIFAEPVDSMQSPDEPLAMQAFELLRAMIGDPRVFLTPFQFSDFGSEFDPNEPPEEKSLGELQCLNDTGLGTTGVLAGEKSQTVSGSL